MRVLVTGDKGGVGRAVVAELRKAGDDAIGFDLVDGRDVRDLPALEHAGAGCAAVVHLAALPSDDFSPQAVMTTNVLGTWHALQAAAAARAERVISISSVQALGIFAGARAPDYLPIDDDHATYPVQPYALSKRLGEQLCASFTQATGIPTVCLRPPAVFAAPTYAVLRARFDADHEADRRPFWEYGAFIDARDLATAVRCALDCDRGGHATLLVCADDICSARGASRELAAAIHPDVPWRGGPEYDAQPFRALIDTRRARELLAWAPRHHWR